MFLLPPLPPSLPPSPPPETIAVLLTSNLLLLLLRLVPSFYFFLALAVGVNCILAEALAKALFMGKEGGRREGGRGTFPFFFAAIITTYSPSSLAPSPPPSFSPGALTGPVSSLLKRMCVSPLIFLTALMGGREGGAMVCSSSGAAAAAAGGGVVGGGMKEGEGGLTVLERKSVKVCVIEGGEWRQRLN
jgi:hypothetical protein